MLFKGLSLKDPKVNISIFMNIVSLYNLNLPGSHILIPEFLKAVTAMVK